MPAPVSRTVRLNLTLLERLERLRARTEARAGVPVDLRTVTERALCVALDMAESEAGRGDTAAA